MRFAKPAAGSARALRFDWLVPLPLADHGGLFASQQTSASLAIFVDRFGAMRAAPTRRAR